MTNHKRFERLADLESAVREQIRKLRSVLVDVRSAGNDFAISARHQASSNNSSYQSQDIYQPTTPGNSSASEQARHIFVQAQAEADRIANRLDREYIPETRRHLESLQHSQINLIKDGRTLSQDPAKHYRRGEGAIRDYIGRAKKLLVEIYSAVQEARRAVSGSPTGALNRNPGLENMLAVSTAPKKRVSEYTSDVIDDQLYRLDTRRYGEDDEVTTTNYPTPYLSREGDREATLLEKATLGGAGPVPLPDNVYHPVSLPSYLRRIKHRGYHSSGSGGRYDAALKYS